MSRVNHDDGTSDLIIDRADPHVWISDQLLRSLYNDQDDSPWAHLRVDATLVRDQRCDSVNCCDQQNTGTCFMGAVLTIKAHNRTVIYKIGQWVSDEMAVWACELLEAV